MPIQLFPDDPKFSSTNWIPANRDPSVWDTEITARVKKVLPTKSVDISIIWNTKEENKGYGLGSAVIVSRGNNKNRFVVPVIIKEYKMAPLDVIITPTKAMKLNDKNIEEALFSGSMGNASTRERGFKNESRQGSSWLPNDFSDYARTDVVYQKSGNIDLTKACMFGNWDILKNNVNDWNVLFTDYVGAWDNEEGLKRASVSLQDGGVMNKFAGEKSIFVEFMNDISADTIHKPDADDTINSYSTRELKPGRKIEVVKKVGPDAYVMLANSIANFDPSMDLRGGGDTRVILTSQLRSEGVVDAVIASLEAAGSTGVVVPWPKDDEEVVVGSSDAPQSTDYGIYLAYDKSKLTKGVLFNRVMDLNGNISKRKVFLTAQGGGVQSKDFKPTRVPMATPTLYNEEYLQIFDKPRAGDSGYLILKDLLIGPIDVLSVTVESWNGGEYSANIAGDNVVKELSTSNYLEGINVRKDALRVNSKFKWVAVPEVIKFKEKSTVQKQACIHYDRNRFHLNGFNLQPKWTTNLKEAEAKFVLATHGMGIAKIAHALNLAQSIGSADLNGLKGVRVMEKAASEKWADNAWAQFSTRFSHSDHDFVKLAAMFDRLDTVDKVLGLNFISKANIARFISAIPLLKDTLEELVRLLVVARIGATEIPEEAVSQSIDSIGEVIDGLENLSLQNTNEDTA